MNTAVQPTRTAAPDEAAFLSLVVARKERIARDIFLFELRDPHGAELPAFTPGSHLTLEAPNGCRRNYSICNAPHETRCYEIAVKRDSNGRGGSISIADDAGVGQRVRAIGPRNNFELSTHAGQFIFVAGGIGITPIVSMMRHLKHTDGGPFALHYLTRDAQSTAFLKELREEFPGCVHLHHDNGDSEQAMDLWGLFERPRKAHVYCCGPKGLMDSVRDMTGHWTAGTVHFESFGVDSRIQAVNSPFTVRLQRSGTRIEVASHESMLDALRRHGTQVSSSCESGTCGSCRTRVLAGEPDHRDLVLSDEEKSSYVIVCTSRSRTPELVLDL